MNLQKGGAFSSLLYLIISLIFASCEGFVDLDSPKNQVVSGLVYSSDAIATAAVNGIYSRMSLSTGFASGGDLSLTLLTGLSADELENYSLSADKIAFYTSSLVASNASLKTGLWEEAYKYIYHANSVLEGLANSEGLTKATSDQLKGEALFVRSFCHFYLSNLFGDIPLALTTDYLTNMKASRTKQPQVYEQLLSDLRSAQALLPDQYATTERVRPNRAAATALLARVLLYNQAWADAETESSKVIADPKYSLPSNLGQVFLKNSSEAIWQLMPVAANINTREGQNFVLVSVPVNVALSRQLALNFETGDKRRLDWVGSISTAGQTYYFPYKYKIRTGASPLSEYSMVLRLAEQYLIRAEARAKQGKIALAVGDINVIRERAGLTLLKADDPGLSTAALTGKIQQERRFELFSEYGHRWMDLKRTGSIDSVMVKMKGANWNPGDALYPIPLSEISSNTNLLPQNPGY